MVGPFFRLAMQSVSRQSSLRYAAIGQVCVLAFFAFMFDRTHSPNLRVWLGYCVIGMGVVQGATIIGWRLTQLPRSQALEFLLTSPIQPFWLFASEALVGIARLALVSITGIPLLVILCFQGAIRFEDVPFFVAISFVWGVTTGLGLIVWAYETRGVRRVGELVSLFGVLIYLIVGVLAAENLRFWLQAMPEPFGEWLFHFFRGLHDWNPFGVMQYWLGGSAEPWLARERMFGVLALGVALSTAFFVRGSMRLLGHFHDRHYRPIDSSRKTQTELIGDHPLSWWAVRRVMEYSGRINLYLAGGFSVLYAAYMILGDQWPPQLGRMVFHIFEQMGGPSALVTGLVLLAAVPAAFQYGLWDAGVQDRCRRLELLLLTDLAGNDYRHAACAAAWKRGKGYFAIALVLWGALWWSGRAELTGVIASMLAAASLWLLWFVLGFRSFSSGFQANGLGSMLTLGMPFLVFIALRSGHEELVSLIPPGAVYGALVQPLSAWWFVGPLTTLGFTLWLDRRTRKSCDGDLRAWYDRNQGARLIS